MSFYRRRRRRSSYTPTPSWTPPADASATESGAVVREFDSFAKFLEGAHAASDYTGHRSSKSGDASFSRSTFEQAMEWGKFGWLEGAAEVRKYSETIFTKLAEQIEREDILYDVEGRNFDIALVNANEPECWQQFETNLVEGPSPKYIRIVVNNVASGGVDASTILKRGAVISALVELLEFAGHRVELTVVTGIRDNRALLIKTVVKRFDEPLDMPKVAYAAGHPSVLRRHIFALMENLPAAERAAFGVGGGYGYPIDVPDTPEWRGDLYVPKMGSWESQWENETTAIEWITKELERQGVKLLSAKH